MSADAPSLIHPTYRYLDRAVRLAGLTLAQWSQLVAAGVGAWLLAQLLPFSSTYNLSVAISLAGMPVAASLAAGADTVHPLAQARAVMRWRRVAAVYMPGADATVPSGYRLLPETRHQATDGHSTPITSIDELWD
ncbi:MAG TPA: hypothetical protein VF549_08220 [Solirubrobacteraceae bacterium]|jgi:hypothetical protein